MKKKKFNEQYNKREIASVSFQMPDGTEGVIIPTSGECTSFGIGGAIEFIDPPEKPINGNKIKSATWNRN